jgi:hypothetical protein
MLMFGREIELPIDLLYGPHPEKQGNVIGSEGSYLWNLTQTLWSIHNIAREKMKQASDRQKRQYDHRVLMIDKPLKPKEYVDPNRAGDSKQTC